FLSGLNFRPPPKLTRRILSLLRLSLLLLSGAARFMRRLHLSAFYAAGPADIGNALYGHHFRYGGVKVCLVFDLHGYKYRCVPVAHISGRQGAYFYFKSVENGGYIHNKPASLPGGDIYGCLVFLVAGV